MQTAAGEGATFTTNGQNLVQDFLVQTSPLQSVTKSSEMYSPNKNLHVLLQIFLYYLMSHFKMTMTSVFSIKDSIRSATVKK